jgi:hyperosmotically inducible periplasmic protein
MAKSRRLVLLVAVALALGSACTPRAEQQTKEVTQDVREKAGEIAEETKDKTKEIAERVVDKSKQVLTETGEAISDGWITTKIKAKFADEKLLKGSTIDVDTKNRIVTLKGTVVSEPAKLRAAAIAGGTEGVGRVVDELVVKSE